jgi:Mn-dependent DtxR family transcriptional regulator
MSLDRMQHNEVPLTQEFAARLLGVRREGVTEAAGRLREAGIVGCRRGAFSVQDRGALEAHACGCYRVVKNEYDRLLTVANPESVTAERVAHVQVPMPAPAVGPTVPGWHHISELAG